MYDLVSDVGRYPEFVPWCRNVVVQQRDETSLTAAITMALAGVRLFFIGHNTMEPNKSVCMEQVEGPFRFMRGRWSFSGDDDDWCVLSLEFEFEMRGPVVRRALEPLFALQVEKTVQIFRDRAAALYGDDSR